MNESVSFREVLSTRSWQLSKVSKSLLAFGVSYHIRAEHIVFQTQAEQFQGTIDLRHKAQVSFDLNQESIQSL